MFRASLIFILLAIPFLTLGQTAPPANEKVSIGTDFNVFQPKNNVSIREMLDYSKEVLSESRTKEYYKEDLKAFDEFVNELAVKYRFNGDILVGLHSDLLYYNSFGFSNPKLRDTLESNERFQLASVTKQFTAASILRLQEQGKLSIEDPVVKYLPDFKFDNIQIKHLLNHSSGLPDYLYLMEALWKEDDLPENDDVLALINQRVRVLGFVPGSQHLYSNTGYVILALLAEKVSSIPYSAFLRNEFFIPLKMDNTFIYRGSEVQNTYPEHLVGFDRIDNKWELIAESVTNGSVGDKGVYTTAKDLHKWFRALKSGKVLKEESMKSMFYYQGYEKDSKGFGMGFKLEKNLQGKLKIYHNGRWEGFRNGLVYYP